MPKDLNNKPRKKKKNPVDEETIIDLIEPSAGNPGERKPIKKKKGECPSGSGGRRR